VDILCAAVADGRLTLAELAGRVGAALSAHTCTELAMLIADLPTARRAPPAATPARRTELPQTRWSLVQSLTAP